MQVIIKNDIKRIAIVKTAPILGGCYKVIRNIKETNKTYSTGFGGMEIFSAESAGLSLSSAYAIYNGLLNK